MEQAAPSYRIIQGESASACLSQSWLSQTFSVVAFIMHGAQGQSQSTKYDTKRSIESFAATLFFFLLRAPPAVLRLTYLNVASFGSLNALMLLPARCNWHCGVCFILKTEIICKKIIDLKRAAPLHTNFVRLISRGPKYTGAINVRKLPSIRAFNIGYFP